MYDSISLSTSTPVAFDSPDHLLPWGTARDNSTNPRFNLKLFRLFAHLGRPLKVLDLGCSGGGFIRSLLDQGCLAVGIEGSDYSKKHARAEWPRLADKFLFTGDITREYQILGKQGELQNSVLFDVITAWEVMEHLPSERLDMVIENMKRHLEPGGLIILSVSPNIEIVRGTTLHLTVQSREWWSDFFAKHGLSNIQRLESYFNTQLVRGPRQNAPGSFHFFLSLQPNIWNPQKLSWKEWIIDRWLFSKPQRLLKKLVVGE